MIFLLLCEAEIKDLPIQKLDFNKKLYCLVLKNTLEVVIVHNEQRFKIIGEIRFVELLNPKIFHAYKKHFLMKIVSTLDVYKNMGFGCCIFCTVNINHSRSCKGNIGT